MKRITLTIGTLFVAAIATLMLVAAPAMAEDYQYKIRVFAGNRGSFSSDPVEYMVDKGTNVDLYRDIETPKIEDEKYVRIGYRVAGADTLVGDGKINGVQEDMDFVVAYGVEAELVPYTLQFVEYGTGQQLAEPQTYYGKPGDKPVASYEYIAGYRPRYMQITGTLSADEDNIWTFEYIPLEEGETIETVTTNTTTNVTTVPGTQTQTTTTTTAPAAPAAAPAATTTTTTAAGGNAAAGGAAAAAAPAGADDEEAATTTIEDDEVPMTQEILDLDNPLAGPGGDGSSTDNAANFGKDNAKMLSMSPVQIGCIAAGLIAALGIGFFFFKRKKDKEEEEYYES